MESSERISLDADDPGRAEAYRLLVDLHRTAARQGPGGEPETRKALDLAMLDTSRRLKIADIGCGTGASSLLLAREVPAHITAVDLSLEFLEVLQANARIRGLNGKISALACSMDALPFSIEEFDVIWSEGAIYNIGFETGIAGWKQFLKKGGMLVVSEITWLTCTRPAEIQAHWEREYPEIDTASTKMAVLERHGYTPLAYFLLPQHCWTENYYRPLQERFAAFLQRNEWSEQARSIVRAEETEIALYRRYNSYYGYGVYIARRPA